MLALTFALLVPGAHVAAQASLAVTMAGETAAVEYDLVESAPRPPSSRHHTHRPAPTARRAPFPPSPPPPPTGHPLPVPAHPRPPYVLHTLRSVVLRC
ncbi:hypothetical protein Sipo8835_20000 [Streptomyces ipomoeae]|uniref:Tat pathway signal sequence domain protein n=2 Tax=Streptomyces ipomoeae TaxID=103232 RepID=L1KPT6_9ACTN|nr:hypothetical protein STRIP9103_04623 [Streptomyces ipomoeae 91-03]TQE24763.1 hypothetical protein SipoB123_17715 [Streptomyces ipomoeae]TQE32614.1 hypothetical protein Sipo8835_20000 [Streptomyces ipomoeae]TQE39209.1 hypothetical protein Sipo7851_04385 [Streptomyces ipomoeae]